MRSASAAASTVASRGRSWRPSSPTPWWVLKVISRTGTGGWSGPGAGLVPRASVTRSACHLRRDRVRQRQVGDQLQPLLARVVPVGDEQPEGGVPVVQDQLAELVAEVG